MNYYVDMHSNLLPGLAGLENRALTEQEAEERLAKAEAEAGEPVKVEI